MGVHRKHGSGFSFLLVSAIALVLSCAREPGEAATRQSVAALDYETSVWFDTTTRVLASRSSHALVFDSLRGEVVVFGGLSSTGAALNDTWVWNGTTWTQRMTTRSPPARYGCALAFDSTRGEVVLFGGAGSGVLGDTWSWNGATASWTERTPASSPPARTAHALAFDSVRGEVVLFGGGGLGSLRYNDLWVWNGAAGSWTQRTPAAVPSARFFHSLAFDSARGEVVLFGGTTGSASLNDTWVWNGATSVWTQRAPASAPPVRSGHGAAFDSARGEVVLFAGNGDAGIRNDTWSWNGTSWTQRSPATSPPGRMTFGAAFDSARGEVVVFGGNGGAGALGDTWVWNGATSSWTQRLTAPVPAARSRHALAFDSARGEGVLFGGVNSSFNPLNDTWVWTGGALWTQRTPSTSPVARSHFALAFDAVRNEVVMFGGRGFSTDLGDTWIWSGAASSWTQRFPASSPSARSGHAMAFDAARGEVVLHGGGSGLTGAVLSDTWVWNGASSSWTQRAPASSPAQRVGHALAFDSVRGEVVLFGGIVSIGVFLAETWVWNGSTWTQRLPASAPPGRENMALSFNTARAEVVLFGGTGATGRLNDTWIWNGAASTWTQRTPPNPPPNRANHAMTYDSARGESVLFGGEGPSGALSDTWVHRTIGSSCASNADCLLGSFCTDGVCCNAASCGSCRTCAGTSPGRCAPVTNAEDPDSCALRDGKSCSGVGECKGALGAAAAAGPDCASGFVVDGVCCASSSCPACQTCDVALTQGGLNPGRCDYARVGSDPKNDCADEGASTCKQDGACDGRGACRLYEKGMACASNVCSRNAATGRFCTGAGECATSDEVIACGRFACRDGACRTACTELADCAALHHCESGQCVEDRGATCSADGHTVTSPEGTSVECAPYACEGARCRDSCTRKTDCFGDSDCTLEGRCVPFAPQASDGGSGCGVAASTRSSGGWPLVFACALLASSRGRQRRARSFQRGDGS